MNSRRCFLAELLIAAAVLGCGQREVDRWLGDLQSADIATRRRAAQALATEKQSDDRIVPALSAGLKDIDLEVRRWSCRGLGEHGAMSAQTALEERLKDSETSVRRAAAFALQ